MLAEKGNKVYTITESQIPDYQSQGFDVYNDDGTIIEYGKGKTVPYEDYMKLKNENETLEKEIQVLQKKLSDFENTTVEAETKTPCKGKKAGA